MGKITRGINNEFAEIFNNTAVYDLLLKYPDELFLGIRNNYINIYYRGLSICKGKVVKGEFKAEIAKRYLDSSAPGGYTSITPGALAQHYKRIKKNIDTFYACKHKEKDAQQRLVNNNNGNPDSEWICIDIEYKKQRLSGAEADPGRFDIIAVTKAAPHRVALIELKCGVGAIGGSSGILKHACDYRRFLQSGEFENHLIPEIVDMVRSYNMIFPECTLADSVDSEDAFCRMPEFYFITLESRGDRARSTMRRYVRNDVERAARDNVRDKLGIDITIPNEEGFTPIFLFADGDGSDIDKIIGDSNYLIGL